MTGNVMLCNTCPMPVLIIKRLLLAAVASLLTVPVSAVVAQQPEEAVAPAYQVEVLVFRNLDQSRTTPEVMPRPEPEIEAVLDMQLERLEVSVEPGADTDPVADVIEALPAWQPVAADALLLSRDAARLRSLGAYDVLAHLAWIQPAEDVAQAAAIDLADLGAIPDLAGEIRFYQKRYLHLAFDIALNDPTGRATIVDSRRIRLGRTVYFDQPAFGVLAIVTEAPEQPAVPAAGSLQSAD